MKVVKLFMGKVFIVCVILFIILCVTDFILKKINDYKLKGDLFYYRVNGSYVEFDLMKPNEVSGELRLPLLKKGKEVELDGVAFRCLSNPLVKLDYEGNCLKTLPSGEVILVIYELNNKRIKFTFKIK